MATKPTDDIPAWAENLSDPADILDPGEPYRLNGFNVIRQIPVRAYWNWIQRAVGRWLTYFDEAHDELVQEVIDEVERLDGRIDDNTPAVRYFDSYDAMAAGLEEGEAGVVVDPLDLQPITMGYGPVATAALTGVDRVYTSGDHVYAFDSTSNQGVTRYTRALTGATPMLPLNPKVAAMTPSGPVFATQTSAITKFTNAHAVDWTAQYDTSGDKVRGIDSDGEIIVAVGDISTAGDGGAGNVKAWDIDGNHLWTTDVDTGVQCNDVHVMGGFVWVATESGLYPLDRATGVASTAEIGDSAGCVTGDGKALYVSHTTSGTNYAGAYLVGESGGVLTDPMWEVSGVLFDRIDCSDSHVAAALPIGGTYVYDKDRGIRVAVVPFVFKAGLDHGAIFCADSVSGEVDRYDLPSRVQLYRRVPSTGAMTGRRYRTNLEPQG